ncbi:phosphoglycerate mutase family protein-like protein [Macroventuria anomochaeta]|uniref:Phosphoglycerate mutase family protein-like protein n=1 Tax=Macroventuria anomochaeta TaxID=301207 RepID=A0ACB6RVK2_9PLEO|nr:phosphoglycerate mutase family protein-like protein [Macroventuria anomochaeta]KAF2626076.1 phosphoglycerate mutase family protein-like protein [Macroventuria anomochaeta]
MPPRIHIIRHAQGEHNATRNDTIRDAVLTQKGKGQCSTLQSAFKYHNDIDIVFSSPLRRTIQTASLSLGPTLARREVPIVLLPSLQEVSNLGCDVGLANTTDDVKQMLPTLFAKEELPFDYNKIDTSHVTEGWNSKKGYWAYERDAITKRAADLRGFLMQRPEKQLTEQIVLVTHGAFTHFLTEDWDVRDPMTGTAWLNCEHRIFDFTSDSTTADAHLRETDESRSSRGVEEREHDPHVLEELAKVSSNESQS